jgi:hypothetical protein
MTLFVVEYSHKLFFADAQTAQYMQPFVLVFAYIAEYGLGEVLHHVFCLSLLPFFVVFFLFEIAIVEALLGRATYFTAKVDFF